MFIGLIDASWRALLTGGLAWCVLRLLRVNQPALEQRIWRLVLCTLVVMPLVPSLRPAATTLNLSAMPLPATQSGTWMRPIVLIYGMIGALLLARIALGLLAAVRLWRSAQPLHLSGYAHVALRSSGQVTSPVTIGSGVVLPATWSQWTAQERAAVLAHEASHVKHKDFYWLLLARVCCALFWLNPLSWWLVRRLMILAEHVSDAAAIITPRDAPDYAAMLLSFATGDRRRLVDVGLARRSSIAIRVERILRDAASPSGAARCGSRMALGLVGALAFVVALPGVTWQPVVRLRPLIVTRIAPPEVEPMPGRASPGPMEMTQTASLNTGDIARLNTDDITRLNTGGVAQLNTDVMTPLNTDVMAPLNTDRMAPLNTDRMAPLNTGGLSNLAPLRSRTTPPA